MALTHTQLQALKPRPSPIRSPAAMACLSMEALPPGTMTWRFQYYLQGKRKKVTLWRYPDLRCAAAGSSGMMLRLCRLPA
jgi:hypothetical protein